MGRLNRIKSNIMSWVRPSNNKLIDRAIRYVRHLLDFYKGNFQINILFIINIFHIFQMILLEINRNYLIVLTIL